jgi:hypothetical protein
MERIYTKLWKQYLNESVEWKDGDLSIRIQEDSSNKDYHNIWISNTTTRTTYVWMVYADPDMPLISDIRIDVKSIDESTKMMSYRYDHPTDGWKSGKNKISDDDWAEVKNNYAAAVKGGKIKFAKVQGKNFVVYLEFKKSFKY